MNMIRCASALALFFGLSIPLSGGLVENPSFELTFNDEWPHYDNNVTGWIGASGTNLADGPFHNAGTPIPDGLLVGFKQGGGEMTQEIFDLEAGKQYVIQFFYDARGCCGGTVDIGIEIDTVEIDKIVNVQPSTEGDPYKFRSAAFTPESDLAVLGFRTTTSGDATALIDAVSIVQRDEGNRPLMNPSFEASGTPDGDGELFEEMFLSGWEFEGSAGINKVGENFADNGATTDQDHVAFINGVGSLAQSVPNVVDEATYSLTFSYNAGDEGTARLVVTSGNSTLLEEDVTPVGGNNPYRTKTIEFQSDGDAIDLKFSQTNEGAVLLLDDVRLVGEAGASFPPIVIGPSVSLITPGQKAPVSVTVPAARLAVGDITVSVRISQFEIAEIVDADGEGTLELQFTADGEADVTQMFEVEGIGDGRVVIEVTDSAGLDVSTVASIEVSSSLLRNASFEVGDLPDGVGYGEIVGWDQGAQTGVNDTTQPFLDNGLVPDRKRVAVLQGTTEISQEVLGLTAGESYWLQFNYNARNCCGGTIGLTVTLGEKELVAIADVTAVGLDEPFHFQNAIFTADGTGGLLKFATVADGDATALVDAITIVPRPASDIVVKNPSFEPSAPAPGVGYLGPDPVAGWELLGGYGVNGDGLGPFTDNGRSNAGGSVLFIQNNGSASQLIEGLTVGTTYTLTYKVNRRACCGDGGANPDFYEVTINDEPVFDEELEPGGAGGEEPYFERSVDFTPVGTSARISFIHTNQGDQTLLLDDIRVFAKGGGPNPSGFDVPLSIAVIGGNTARLSWPRDSPDAVLQKSTDLAAWTFVDGLPFVDGEEVVVADVIDGPVAYYRLVED